MNRVIKFRAWDVENKRLLDVGDVIFHEFTDINDQFDDEDFIFLQYTGLKDKNNKLIFEGDIVDLDDYGRYIIEWSDEEGTDTCGFTTNMISKCTEMYQMMADFDAGCAHGYVVIGNIYENPELIK